MLKLIFVALFLSFGICSFSCEKEDPQTIGEEQAESLLYLRQGEACLLVHDPWQALKNFRQATECLNRWDESAQVMEFLISFGEVVAYDSLGLRDECKQALGSLFLAAQACPEEDDEVSLIFAEDEKELEFLRTLAYLAPSSDVKGLLLIFIDEEEWLGFSSAE